MTLLLQDALVISPKTKQQVDKNTADIAKLQEKSAIAYHFKGSKPTFNDLPTTGNEVGDVWDVQDTGVNYGWTGTEWDELGPFADLEPYLTKEEATSTYYSKSEVDALLNQAYVTTSWTIPLPVADWVENKQTFTIQGLTVDSSLDLNPVVPTTREEMIKLSNAGLFISALEENSVTIECMNLPTEDLVVKLKREITTNVVLDGINVQLAEINGV